MPENGPNLSTGKCVTKNAGPKFDDKSAGAENAGPENKEMKVSEQFLNGTSAHYRPFSAMKEMKNAGL